MKVRTYIKDHSHQIENIVQQIINLTGRIVLSTSVDQGMLWHVIIVSGFSKTNYTVYSLWSETNCGTIPLKIENMTKKDTKSFHFHEQRFYVCQFFNFFFVEAFILIEGKVNEEFPIEQEIRFQGEHSVRISHSLLGLDENFQQL